MAGSHPTKSTRLHDETLREILNYIRNQRLGRDDRLPAQDELAEQLNISRAKLREALASLASEGLIRQVHGIGTFVAEDPSVVRSNAELNLSITEMIRDQGMEPGTSEVKISLLRAQFEVDAETGETAEADLMCLARVRTADGLPFAYTVAYLPRALKGLALEEQAYYGSLYEYLQDHCNEFVSEARSVIEACVSGEEISQKLAIPIRTPILIMRQHHYNQLGKLLMQSVDYFVQNRLQLTVRRSRPGF